MPYKVFLVEDEIVAREGIRDHINWQAAGLEFCGEAPDGEIALPLIRAIKPDILITDIRMPFVDGLELCRIVRGSMPWIKIIILSGYDEFSYAQEAIKLGVTEYLLKPIGARDLLKALKKVTIQIEQEKRRKESLRELEDQVKDSQALLREKFLLELVLRGTNAIEALETSRRLEIDIIARYYLLIFIKAVLGGGNARQFDYHAYQKTKSIILELVDNYPGDIIPLTKGLEETVLILKGKSSEQVKRDGYRLSELIKDEVEGRTQCLLTIGIGSPKERLEDISQSFFEALASTRDVVGEIRVNGSGSETDKVELPKFDRSAVEKYLKYGDRADFNQFFDTHIQQFGQTALHSHIFMNYIFIDAVLATANFIDDLGGDVNKIIPEIEPVERLLTRIQTIDQIYEQTRVILIGALDFRDSRASGQYAKMISRARDYINSHYTDPGISLSAVAEYVNLSPSHFSAVFSRETEETYKEYLTRVRIDKAKELLRTTALKIFEISNRIGYSDPHYFSSVFKKVTGLSPTEFRTCVQTDSNEAAKTEFLQKTTGGL